MRNVIWIATAICATLIGIATVGVEHENTRLLQKSAVLATPSYDALAALDPVAAVEPEVAAAPLAE